MDTKLNIPEQVSPPYYSDEPQLPHYNNHRTDEPIYFESISQNHWPIVILNRYFTDGFRIFVSLDAAGKFEALKRNKSPEVNELKAQGYGIPLFKAITPIIPTTKFLTFRRYMPTNSHPFDIDKDYYNFCTVRKKLHFGYDSYIFDFVPNPSDSKSDFQVVMFSHSTIPISDYIYKGEKHRWIDESIMRGFRERFYVKYGFKHTVLREDQISLCDSWDGVSDKLDKSKSNPLLNSYLKTKFSLSARFIKPEYYGSYTRALLGEMESFFLDAGYAELKLQDIYNLNLNVDYNSIHSVNVDALVQICVATCLKRQKDIIDDRRRRSNASSS